MSCPTARSLALFGGIACIALALAGCDIGDEPLSEDDGQAVDADTGRPDLADGDDTDTHHAELFRGYMESYSHAYADSACAMVFRCPEYAVRSTVPTAFGPWPMHNLYGRFPTEERCALTLRDSAIFAPSSALVRGIESGRISYSESAAEQCVDAVRHDPMTGCADPFALSREPTDCPGLLEGRTFDDEHCVVHAECASGLCDFEEATGCLGRCVKSADVPEPAQAGEACRDTHCDDGLICSGLYATDDPYCIPFATKHAGDMCSWRNECALGLYCTFDGVCEPVERLLPYGATNCRDWGKRCEAGLACTHRSELSDYWDVHCDPVLGPEADCIWDDQCEWGFYCTGSIVQPGICAPRKRDGGACEPVELQCGEFSRCVEIAGTWACRGRFSGQDACAHPED